MTHLPDDLVTLPTMPYDERPADLPLDREECRTAIWMVRGNISEAAKLLKVTSLRLRNFIRNNPFLSAEAEEAREILADIAEDNVYDALTDDTDPQRRDSMSRFVLGSIGRRRGYGQNTPGLTLSPKGGRLTVVWDDGTNVLGDPKTIEHSSEDAA